MRSMQRLTLPTMYCIILYASSKTVSNSLNLVLSAFYHSLTTLQSLHRPIRKGPASHLVYHTSALPKRHESRFLRSLLASLFDAFTCSWLVKLKTLWYTEWLFLILTASLLGLGLE